MAEFVYEARDKYGKLVKGSVGGDSLQVVSSRLQAAGYVPVRIERKATESRFGILRRGRVSERDLNLFTRQLWTLQCAGLPLLTSLRSLEEQTMSAALRLGIAHVIIDIESGLSLHEALARQPHIFDKLFVHMVSAGEASGRLDDILERLSFLGERNAETKAKVKAALRYPILTFIAITVAFFIIVTFTVPKFAALFAIFKTQLPLPTRVLIKLNAVVRENWLLLSGLFAGAGMAFRRLIRTRRGERIWHVLLLRLPVFGGLLHEIYMSRFARNLATLIQSGLPLMESLELVADTIDNVVVRDAILQIRKSVLEGRSMHEPMSQNRLFSPMVVQMIAIGEETGKVDDLLNHVGDYFDRETDLKVKNMTALIEPILICVMGALVLLLALGVFLPMWNLINVFKQA